MVDAQLDSGMDEQGIAGRSKIVFCVVSCLMKTIVIVEIQDQQVKCLREGAGAISTAMTRATEICRIFRYCSYPLVLLQPQISYQIRI
jgi:hypothetical protein